MHTTRRTFLRVLGSAAIGAAAAAAIPAVATAPAPVAGPMWDAAVAEGPSRALTLDMLEAAYQSCVLGAERPMMGIISSSTARQLGLVYDAELKEPN